MVKLQLEPNGLLRDFTKRYLICHDQFWWTTSNSPWRVNEVHSWAKPLTDGITGQKCEAPKLSEWRDRVMDLCEIDLTHQNFGLGYNDLMRMDPATFEEIEDRVHRLMQERQKTMNNIENGSTPTGNLLKEPRK